MDFVSTDFDWVVADSPELAPLDFASLLSAFSPLLDSFALLEEFEDAELAEEVPPADFEAA